MRKMIKALEYRDCHSKTAEKMYQMESNITKFNAAIHEHKCITPL